MTSQSSPVAIDGCERPLPWHLNGFLVLLALLAAVSFGAYQAIYMENYAIPAVISVIVLFCLSGLTVMEPNTAMTASFFGKYVGTLRKDGFFWTNPLYMTGKLSLRLQTHEVGPLKVNDKNGNPIEVGAVIVYRVQDTYATTFKVDNYKSFLAMQSEAALRQIAAEHSYDGPENEVTLRGDVEAVALEIAKAVSNRVGQAGIEIQEARLSSLAYAPEIAQVMLRKQQAQAIVDARETVVKGAVEIVEKTVKSLKEKGIDLPEAQQHQVVRQLLVVLCSDTGAHPVIEIER